jgi:hypothetical protein
MIDDLTRSVKEAVSDAYISPETTTGGGFIQNILTRFKGRLIFSAIFFMIFAAVVLGTFLMVFFLIISAS